MVAGKVAVVADMATSQGCAQALRALGWVWVTKSTRPARRGAMEGYRVVTMDYAADKADIFVRRPWQHRRHHARAMKRMKNRRSCNIGHFDNEIEVAALKQ